MKNIRYVITLDQDTQLPTGVPTGANSWEPSRIR